MPQRHRPTRSNTEIETAVTNLQERLMADRKVVVLYAIAGFIGLAFALHLLGWAGISGTSEYWSTTHNDSVQSVAGLQYFMSEGWGWPLLNIESYGYPDGTNLTLTGSIPLLAVLAKLLGPVLPDGLHYFGYWLAFSFAMQAVSMVALLVVLGWRSYATAIVGSGFALLQTVLLTRYFHVSFMGQFLIIFTIAVGVSATKSDRPIRQMRWLLGLLAVTFFVQIYLFAMVAVLAVAFVAGLSLQGRIDWRPALGWLATMMVGTGALIGLSGLATTPKAVTTGFGIYSMNLVALIARDPDATGGQYEGFSYLGLGAILLVGINLVASRAAIRKILHTYWVPALAAVLMALYAMSASVYVGDRLLVELPVFGPIAWLSERFRSSGRFVWPLVYMVVPVAIILTFRRFRTGVAVALLFGALLVQIVDMGTTVRATRGGLQHRAEQVLDTAAWVSLIDGHTLVQMTPHPCVTGTGDPSFASREVQRIAAQANVAITTSSAAAQAADCGDPAFGDSLVPGELRVVWRAHQDPYRPVGNPEACVDLPLGTVCTLDQATLAAFPTLGS